MVRAIVWSLVATVYGMSTWGVYTFLYNRAVDDAANGGRRFRWTCSPSISLENCRSTELPVHVQMFSEVYVPTGLYVLVGGILIFTIVKMLRMSADPADNDAKK